MANLVRGFPLSRYCAQHAADLAAQRKARGRTLDLRDTLIAGIALELGALRL